MVCNKNKSRTMRPTSISFIQIHGKRSLSYARQAMQLVVATLSVALVLFSLLIISGDVELNPGPESGANVDGPGLEGKVS